MTYDPAFLTRRIQILWFGYALITLAQVLVEVYRRLTPFVLFEDGSFIAGTITGCIRWAICAL